MMPRETEGVVMGGGAGQGSEGEEEEDKDIGRVGEGTWMQWMEQGGDEGGGTVPSRPLLV